MSPARTLDGEKVRARHARADRRRPDIQGLRALAVAVVVINHAWPSALPGGFVGVDVFFVISGFLITDHLLREIHLSGTINLSHFWARRARRLLPASLLVLLVTVVASLLVLPRSLWQQTLDQAFASALYVQNWLLAFGSVDYFASDDSPSPVTHYWSLSVEEQFYLVWPLLLLAAVATVRSRRRRVLVAVAIVIAGLGLASLVYSIIVTIHTPQSAYFVTPARAWEFSVGGLVAASGLAPRSGVVRRALASVGWVAIAASAVFYSAAIPMPGAAALLPVAGAALVLVAGGAQPSSSARGPLAWRPVQYLGDISYSLYLWHWPLFVLFPFMMPGEGDSHTWLALAISLALAAVTKTLVEDPVRVWRPLISGGEWRTLVAVLCSMALVVGACLAGGGVLRVANEQALEELERQTSLVAAEASTGVAECFGAPAMLRSDRCLDVWNGIVVPDPAIASSDTADAFDCWVEPQSTAFASCDLVDGSALSVALVGDSHAAMLSVPLAQIAEENDWDLDVYLRSACPLTDARVFYDAQFADNCASHQPLVEEAVSAPGAYDLVIVTAWAGLFADDPDLPDSQRVERLQSGYESAWARLIASGVGVLVIADNAETPATQLSCVETTPDFTPSDCVSSRAKSVVQDPAVAAARSIGAPVVDLTDAYCGPDGCPMVIGGVLVRFDAHHLTATFASTLAPILGPRLVDTIPQALI